MKRNLIYALLILVLGVLGIVAALAYPIVNIKMSASVLHPETRFIPASSAAGPLRPCACTECRL